VRVRDSPGCAQLKASGSLPRVHDATPTKMEGDVPILPSIITLDFVTAMMDCFRANQLIRREDVLTMLDAFKTLLARQVRAVTDSHRWVRHE
jgi:hypothetical protein